MDNMDTKAVETLCQAIVQTVKNNSDNVQDFVCNVIDIGTNRNGSQNCTVTCQGHNYTVNNGTGITFKKGDTVLVHCINGDFNNKIIIAKM